MWIRIACLAWLLSVSIADARTPGMTPEEDTFVGFAPDGTYWVAMESCNRKETMHICRTDARLPGSWPVAFGDRAQTCISVDGWGKPMLTWGRARWIDNQHVRPKPSSVGPRGEKVTLVAGKNDTATITVAAKGKRVTTVVTGVPKPKLAAAYFARDGRSVAIEVSHGAGGCAVSIKVAHVELAPLGTLAPRTDAELAIRGLLTEAVEDFVRPKPNLALYAKDALLFSRGSAHTRLDPAAYVATARAFVAPGRTVETWADQIHVRIAPDGKTAWAAFEILMRIPGDGFTTLGFRVSWLLTETAGTWTIVGGGMSKGLIDEWFNVLAQRGELPASARYTAGDADDGPADVLAAFTKLFAAKGTTLADGISDRPDVFVWGSESTEQVEGGLRYRKAMRGYKKPLHRAGPAQATISGTLAWVAAPVEAEVTGPPSYRIPFRTLFVFEKIGGKWLVVHAHWAAPDDRK